MHVSSGSRSVSALATKAKVCLLPRWICMVTKHRSVWWGEKDNSHTPLPPPSFLVFSTHTHSHNYQPGIHQHSPLSKVASRQTIRTIKTTRDHDARVWRRLMIWLMGLCSPISPFCWGLALNEEGDVKKLVSSMTAEHVPVSTRFPSPSPPTPLP